MKLYPKLRLYELSEHRLRKAVCGLGVDEYKDKLTTASMANALYNHNTTDILTLSSHVSHRSRTMGPGIKSIKVSYVAVEVEKSELAQAAYGQ